MVQVEHRRSHLASESLSAMAKGVLHVVTRRVLPSEKVGTPDID
jgi:hypothetical protein